MPSKAERKNDTRELEFKNADLPRGHYIKLVRLINIVGDKLGVLIKAISDESGDFAIEYLVELLGICVDSRQKAPENLWNDFGIVHNSAEMSLVFERNTFQLLLSMFSQKVIKDAASQMWVISTTISLNELKVYIDAIKSYMLSPYDTGGYRVNWFFRKKRGQKQKNEGVKNLGGIESKLSKEFISSDDDSEDELSPETVEKKEPHNALKLTDQSDINIVDSIRNVDKDFADISVDDGLHDDLSETESLLADGVIGSIDNNKSEIVESMIIIDKENMALQSSGKRTIFDDDENVMRQPLGQKKIRIVSSDDVGLSIHFLNFLYI